MLTALVLAAAVTVTNAGFEESEGGKAAGWTAPSAYRVASGEGRNGSAALRYDLKEKGGFLHQAAQDVKLEGGKAYRISAWVKTKDVRVEKGERAAAVGLEWWDSKGKCRGAYSRHVTGTMDWQRIEIETPRLEEDARRFRVQVYVGYGKTTGTAWFDDVQIEEAVRPPVEGLHSGAYRDVAADGKVKFYASINCPTKDLSRYVPALTYVDAKGKSRTVRPSKPHTALRAEFELQVSDLALGAQEVGFALGDASGATLGTAKRTFRRVKALPPQRVRFDRLNRTIVDGRPFFPLGMYCGVAEEKEMSVYREGPFNCLMPYTEPTKEQLDWLDAHDLKVIYPLKEAFAGREWAKARGILTEADETEYITRRVNEVKDHPAVLAWYLNDELGVDMIDRLERHQKLFERLDDQHPTWTCLYQVSQLGRYLDTFDAIGTDPYPVPRSPISLATEWTILTRDASSGTKPCWQIPQAMDWKWFRSGREGDRMPTEEELRSMTWQMLACGANGIIYYAFHQMRRNAKENFGAYWTMTKRLAGEVKRFEKVFLSGDEPPAFGSPLPEKELPVRLFRDGKTVYALAANATDKPVAADVRISAAVNRAETLFGSEATMVRPGTLHLEIPAWGESLVRCD